MEAFYVTALINGVKSYFDGMEFVPSKDNAVRFSLWQADMICRANPGLAALEAA